MVGVTVYIYDFYDCPRSGICSVGESLYYFECLFDEQEDEYTNNYVLFKLKVTPENDKEYLRIVQKIQKELKNNDEGGKIYVGMFEVIEYMKLYNMEWIEEV